MIVGRLSKDREPLVKIVLHGTRPKIIEAVVDTGFTAYLCLARRHRNGMKLRKVGREALSLPTGVKSSSRSIAER